MTTLGRQAAYKLEILLDMPTITCCMIVKNEAKNLDRCLKSIKPWVNDIIVMDTGSTDATMDIAKSYGAKVCQTTWEDNFSKARNQSIAYATGDWILVMDADEELIQDTAGQLRDLVDAPHPINGFLFKLRNELKGQQGETFVWHPRLFRNHVGFQYEGMVHNKPVINGQVVRCDVTISHWGYNDPDPKVMAAKFKRRVDMIGSWVEREPQNFLARSYLAHAMLGYAGDSDDEAIRHAWEAVGQGEEALRLMRDQGVKGHEPHAYYPIVLALANLKENERCLSVVADCTNRHPWYADPWFYAVQVLLRDKRWAEAEAACFKWFEAQARSSVDTGLYLNIENMTIGQTGQMLKWWGVAQLKTASESVHYDHSKEDDSVKAA